MRFGLFYELQMPRPWGPSAEEKTYMEALDQIELADKLGFHSVWEVEHHFLEEYSHSSAPEVFLAAASQRTRRIRLGHGIVQLPMAFNHPARVAERIAALDLVSGGRVEFGTGQGSSQAELGGFGVDREQKQAEWEESLDVIVRMMTEEPFSGHEGRFLTMPPRNVIPKPRQKPHPPLWMACSRRESILLAARKGLGALSFSFVEPEQAKQWVDEYYSLIASPECVPTGLAVNPQIAVVLPFLCHEDEETAIERGIDGAHFFGFSLSYYYVFGKHQPGMSNIWDNFLAQRREQGFDRELVSADDKPLSIKLLEQGLGSFRGAVGTPAQVSDLFDRYQRAGVDLVILAAQAGNNRHEHICESIELFARSVMPRFAEQADTREAEKRNRLARAIDEALARRPPSRSGPSNYVITPQGEPGPVGSLRIFPQHATSSHKATTSPAGARSDDVRMSLLLRLVRGRTDRQLQRMMPFLAPTIFKGMARSFRPERAHGFSGEIEFQLETNSQTINWVVEVAAGNASARRGPARQPRVALRMSVPDFARISSGELELMSVVMQGRLKAEGELRLVGMLGEMFGGPSRY
ncbi:MAG: LLM class flavin-dependent oxidoreductase [Candidatus Acidiferrales bacterium]